MNLRKSIPALLLSAAALGFGLSAVPTQARAAVTAGAVVVPDPNWNEIFAPYITGRSNTLCLDVPGGSVQNNQPLQLFHCHGSDSAGAPQRWQFIPLVTDPDATGYMIRNTKSHLCLGLINFFSRDRNTPPAVGQEACPGPGGTTPGFNLWIIHDDGIGSPSPDMQLEAATLRSDNSDFRWGICLTAQNTSDANATPLTWKPCAVFDDATQIFRLG